MRSIIINYENQELIEKANVTIKYREEIIAELNSLGSVILPTKDHGCDSDIRIDYINYCPREEAVGVYDMQDYYDKYSADSDANGASLTSVTAYITNFALGYVANGTYYYNPSDTNQRMDIYQVDSNKLYLIRLGSTVSNRFRVMFTNTDVTQVTSNVTGTAIYNTDSPTAYINRGFTTTSSGYILVYKSGNGTEVDTYVDEVDL